MYQPNLLIRNEKVRAIVLIGRQLFSRKSRTSGSGNTGQFKIVSKARDGDDFINSKLSHNENWELFGRSGFRFYMPGYVGPAWHDNISTSFIPSTLNSADYMELECIIQDCPILLRSGVEEMFPGIDTANSPLTIVTLTQKALKQKSDVDVENQTKEFMWAAQEICGKLRAAGYWADFINPFSGHPFHSSSMSTKLFQTDQRFRCIGFQITSKGPCRIILPTTSKKFFGSLFTTAPSSTDQLRDVLKTYETADIYSKDN